MNRDQLIRDLRRYARKRGIPFELLKSQGKGSHYIVLIGAERTTLQSNFDEFERKRVLKQLKINPADL